MLVLMGLTGVAMRELSFVRQPNNFRLKTRLPLIIACSVVVFFLVGYGFTAEVEGGILGNHHYLGFLEEQNHHKMFCTYLAMDILMTALATTSIADRAHLDTHLFFSIVSSSVIFPFILAWTWKGGWLQHMDFSDGCGAAIVHLPAGVISLVANLALKPSLRSAYFKHGNLESIKKTRWVASRESASPDSEEEVSESSQTDTPGSDLPVGRS